MLGSGAQRGLGLVDGRERGAAGASAGAAPAAPRSALAKGPAMGLGSTASLLVGFKGPRVPLVVIARPAGSNLQHEIYKTAAVHHAVLRGTAVRIDPTICWLRVPARNFRLSVHCSFSRLVAALCSPAAARGAKNSRPCSGGTPWRCWMHPLRRE